MEVGIGIEIPVIDRHTQEQGVYAVAYSFVIASDTGGRYWVKREGAKAWPVAHNGETVQFEINEGELVVSELAASTYPVSDHIPVLTPTQLALPDVGGIVLPR